MSARRASERGQSTVEWLALALLVALALAAAAVAAGTAPLAGARALASQLACAVGVTGACRDPGSKLAAALGAELAGLAIEHAPELRYERGMRALPVDPRSCRADPCAEGSESGLIWRSRAGEPAVAFVHAIDCRGGATPQGADCSGRRAGRLYLQYWFYYPGSATAEGGGVIAPAIRALSTAVGRPSHHPDDWESLQLRLGPGGRRAARASSHHHYSYRLGGARGWGPATGSLYVSGGSHAGNVLALREVDRTTPPSRLRLLPLATLADGPRIAYAVTPPWRKRVFADPEYEGTD